MYGGVFREQTECIEFQLNRTVACSLTNFGNGAPTCTRKFYVIDRSGEMAGRAHCCHSIILVQLAQQINMHELCVKFPYSNSQLPQTFLFGLGTGIITLGHVYVYGALRRGNSFRALPCLILSVSLPESLA